MSRKSTRQQREKSAASTAGAEPSAVSAVENAGEVQLASLPAADAIVETSEGHHWKVACICVALAVLVFTVFGQTLHHEFVNYDDNGYVYQNLEVSKALTVCGIGQAFMRKEMGLWTPLVTVSHMLDCRLYGLKPGGHHLTNVLLHLASAILLFLILRQMTGTLWRSAFVAALFAIHPLKVESVAWISERKDVLSGLFFMLTLGAYLRYVRRPGSVGRYLWVLVLFALGLMSKPMLVTLPFVLMLLDYWPLKRLRLHKWHAVAEKLPLLALSIGLCVITLLGGGDGAFSDIEAIPFWVRMAGAPVWVITYLRQLIWPAGLAVIYPHPEAGLPWWPAAAALCGGITFWAFVLRKKHPYLWTGWLWNVGMLAPVLGILQISRHARADHYNYLPQIGLYIALTWVGAAFTGRWRHQQIVSGSVAAVVLSVLSAVAWQQTSYWQNSETLWAHTLGCTRDNSFPHKCLGETLLHRGRVQEAIAEYRESVRINPNASEVRFDLGTALIRQGRIEEAIAEFRESLRINPEFKDAHYNLGSALLQQGRGEEAIAQYREALRINPAFADVHFGNALGSALLQQGRTQEAIAEFREALRINPEFEDAHYNLGSALLQQGRGEEAITQYREALRINPAFADAHHNLGVRLFQQGQTEEAIAHVQKARDLQPANVTFTKQFALMLATAPQTSLREGARALRLATQAIQSTGGNDPLILSTQAAAYAEIGDFSSAFQTANKALQLAESQSNTALADELHREIKLYESNHRFEIIR